MLFAELVAIFDPGFFKKEDKEKKGKVTLSLVVLMSSCAPSIFLRLRTIKQRILLGFLFPIFSSLYCYSYVLNLRSYITFTSGASEKLQAVFQ